MIFPEEDLEQQNVRLKDRNRSFASPVIGDVEEANAYGSSFHVMDLKTESVADLTYLQSQKNLTASTAASGTTTSAAAAGTAGTTASIAEEHQEHQDPSDGLALENSKKLEPIESSKQSTGKERLKKNQLKTKKESQDQEPSVLTESTSTITTGANSGLVEMERDKSSSDKINKHDLPPPTATTWDLYFLGLNIVMCGTLFTWNTGLAAGFWEYFFAMSITGIAYIFLICCLAEMASALPFHGGMYGFIRLTVGPYTGFFVGCCEIVQNILCVTTTVQPIGWMITEMTGWQAKYEPIYWVIFYVTALLICTAKEKIFWRFNAFIAILSIVLIVIFLLGSFPYVNYSKYSYRGHAFTASGVYFFDGLAMLENLPTASWLFMGVELVPLAGGSAIDPKKSLVNSMLGGIATFVVLSYLIFFCIGTQAPGVAEYAEYFVPMNYRYSQMFNMQEALCNIFALPGCYATAFGFLYAAGRQMGAMGKSGLFPEYMGKTLDKTDTPYVALVVGAVVALFISFVSLSTEVEENFLNDLFLVTLLGSYFVYIWTFIGYIIYRKKYSSLKKGFTNPFGEWSAYLGMLFFTLTSICTVALGEGNYRVVLIFGGYLAVMSLYYYIYARKRQFFSEDEKHALFQAYVIKANVARRGKVFANFIPSHSQYSANSVSIHNSHTNSHPASHSRSPSQSSARSVSIRNVSLRSAAQSRIVPTYNTNSIVENTPIPEGHHESNAESNPSGTNSEAVESLS